MTTINPPNPPEPIVETDRRLLRSFTAHDAPFILRLLNEASFLEFIGDRGVRTLADARAYITRVAEESYQRFGFGLYLVVTKADGQPIGMCGLMQKPWLDAPDIAYAFVPEAGSQGYGFEAAAAVLAHERARFGLTRVVAVVTPTNAASIRLLEKLGFTFESNVSDPRDGTQLMRFVSMT